ncbi:MAG: HlyD family efflux transporter periplasmic adaptor subunit [Planctomycetaceae bacterium]|nr:HlyD family efflux transporter periplasmic adaptor subunit [Planctomycetaceae bacterium]
MRPLRARMRPDLHWMPQVHGGEVVWVVKDPVALHYLAFGPEEFSLLQLLDGRRTAHEICRAFERQFVPRRLGLPTLGEFVARMHALGMLVSDAPGQGAQVYERGRRKQRRSFAQSLLSILAIRFRGVDADRFLEQLERRTRWAFRPWFLCAALCLMVSAMLVMLAHPPAASELTQDALLHRENLLALMAAVAISKILHELGHGVACKHFGGESHEIGAMLLVFVPCLYCNVSDAWMIPSKWKRIAVSSAGMFVELLLASACVYLWRFSEPGVVHQVALNIVLLCSVNTLLLNGNPLLRYDGYYVLSDLWGIPNLAQQSKTAVSSLAQRLIGIDPGRDDIRPDRRRLLVAYGVLSGVYRLLVMVGILWMLHRTLAPQGLGSLAMLLSVVTVGGVIYGPTASLARRIRRPSTSRPLNGRRFSAAMLMAIALLAAFLMMPLPQHVGVPFVIEPVDARPVYALMSGRLQSAVACGEAVQQGDVIVALDNPDLDIQIAALSGRLARQQVRVRALDSRRDRDAIAVQELPAAREELAALEQQLETLRQNHARLTMTAEITGVVLPPPVADGADDSGEPAPPSPISREQFGRAVPAGALLCLVGDPQQLVATLVVDEDSVAELQVGQPVSLRADAIPVRRLTGVVTQISRQSAVAPQENVASWSRLLASDVSQGAADQRATLYEARVTLDRVEPGLRIGGRGAALVTVRSETLGRRAYVALRRLFGLRV